MEPPGTAPGSDPLIASAFMSIVPLPEQYEYKGPEQLWEGVAPAMARQPSRGHSLPGSRAYLEKGERYAGFGSGEGR